MHHTASSFTKNSHLSPNRNQQVLNQSSFLAEPSTETKGTMHTAQPNHGRSYIRDCFNQRKVSNGSAQSEGSPRSVEDEMDAFKKL